MSLMIQIFADRFAKFEEAGEILGLREELRALVEADGNPVFGFDSLFKEKSLPNRMNAHGSAQPPPRM